MRRAILFLLLLTFIVGAFSPLAFAGSINEKVKDAGGAEAIATAVDDIASNIVTFVRGIFSIIAVVFVVWAGFVFWGAGGDPARIAQAKRLCGGFIVCLICVFVAETIVGGIIGLFGFELQ